MLFSLCVRVCQRGRSVGRSVGLLTRFVCLDRSISFSHHDAGCVVRILPCTGLLSQYDETWGCLGRHVSLKEPETSTFEAQDAMPAVTMLTVVC